MEATVKITNGKTTKFVTPAIANDAAVMRRFGYWKDGEVKGLAQKTAEQLTPVAEVNLLADAIIEPAEETKAKVVEKLKAAGIKFNPNDKKEVLQSLLTEGK